MNIDQSFDGTNWDVTNAIDVAAATGPYEGVQISETIFAPYVQVRYTNTGTAAQGYMRLFVRATGTRT